MQLDITKFTPRRIGLALSLLIACSVPAWAQMSMRVDGNQDTAVPDAPIRQEVKVNNSTVLLYGTLDAGNNSSQIFKILADGTYVPMVPVLQGNDLEGMDVSPLTGEMYAVTASGTFAGDFWKINKTTGALTLIGNTGLTELISASFHPITGEFWVYKHLGGLYTIDLNTAAATFKYTPVGPGVFKTWEGLAWDNTGTYLYGQDRNLLYRWDPVTKLTQILCTNLSPSGEGLDFSPDGKLWGGLDPNDPAALRLFILDYNTCTYIPSGCNLPMGDIESIGFERPNQPCTGSIGDFVWNDANGNGIQEAGEVGFPNVTVILKTSGGAIITTTTTNASGLYTFPGLCAGDYQVEIDETTLPPGGYVPSVCNAGSDDTVDNNCSPALVNLPTDSTTDTTIDFGYTCGCTDNDTCTADACDEQAGCIHTPISCDDQNVCTVDSCDPTTGCAHAPLDVDDGNLCTLDSCDSETGVHHDPISCDNGNACNRDDCDPASGCTHTVIDCDDHNKCTNDSCDPASGCVNTPISCDDGNACSTDACDPASGCSHTVIDCKDGNSCTNDSCDPVTGCVYLPVNCDDGNACSTDACDPASGCTHTVIDCNDGNSCTNDSCDPASGCVYLPVDCDQGNACTSDSCDPATGCVYLPVNCDDQNACTSDSCDVTDGCIRTPISCDDGDPCTLDSCDSVTGCAHEPVSVDDGDACTTDSCDATGVHHTPISCDDGNTCTNDTCDPATGCQHNTPGCDDGNACTEDRCTPEGGCAYFPVNTDDNNACTDDSCDPATGVSHTPVTCSDGSVCTDDSCDPSSGCVYTPITCDDNNACTTNSCSAETGCVYTPITCDDDSPCTSDFCDPAIGCVHESQPIFSSNSSNFNGTRIRAGRSIWFNANFKASGITGPTTISLRGSTVTFTAGGQVYNLTVPDADIVFDPNASCATTSYNTALQRWQTTVPLAGSDEVFLSGFAFQAPIDLPGGINPVVWSGFFQADQPGVSISWKWSAAVYTTDMSDYNALGVKPTHTASCAYSNSHHAGTPELKRAFVVGGARGGGGSNFTGSWSSTKSVSLVCP